MSTKPGSREKATNLTRIRLRNFTAFSDFSLDLSPGINVFIGKNGVGKTHLMKVCYAACEVARTGIGFGEKLVRVFRPERRHIGRLVLRQPGCAIGFAEVCRNDRRLRIEFAANAKDEKTVRTDGAEDWIDGRTGATFIGVDGMLSSVPPPRSMVGSDDIDDVHTDLLRRALRPLTPGANTVREQLMLPLEPIRKGMVTSDNSHLYLEKLEFSLVADGERRLGILWRLLRNGTLRPGCTLFWDNPEGRLSPGVFGAVMETILELQRVGAQVFLATHNYVILKELDLRRHEDDSIAFHSLSRSNGNGEVRCNTTGDYLQTRPNAISEAFDSLYDRTILRSLEVQQG